MKKISLYYLCILNSCAVGFYPIKGQYLDTPYEIKSKKDFETTWSGVIDMFAQKGLSIKVIDKSSV